MTNHPFSAELPTVNIKNVSIYALGVDGAGTTLAGWKQVEAFWQQYLHRSGANLAKYSVLRNTTSR